MKSNIKSRKGFTLIELLVVIGILAVLAAIAIPSVAGLIDRANVSADKTNSNEMTNAIERFASEYELFCQDIASGTFNKGNMDSAQSRVYNVLNIEDRAGISSIEVPSNAVVDDYDIAIYRDTKYPANAYTTLRIVQNYTKTSSSTFEPKQSDMHYWYSPDCGVVIVAEPEKTDIELDKYIVSGKDAKGNDITSDSVNAQWIDLTEGIPPRIPAACGIEGHWENDKKSHTKMGVIHTCYWRQEAHSWSCQCIGWEVPKGGIYTTYNGVVYNEGESLPCTYSTRVGDTLLLGDYKYELVNGPGRNDWKATAIDKTKTSYEPFVDNIVGRGVSSLAQTFEGCTNLVVAPEIPETVRIMYRTFYNCTSLTTVHRIPSSVNSMTSTFQNCSSLTGTIYVDTNQITGTGNSTSSPGCSYCCMYNIGGPVTLVGNGENYESLVNIAAYSGGKITIIKSQ